MGGLETLMKPDCDEIIPGRLWVGVFIAPEDAGWLKETGFTSVVDLQSEQDLEDYDISLEDLVESLTRMGVELRRVPVQDFSRRDLIEHLPKCVEEIESGLTLQQARVYLHCTAGINRSPTAAAAYLIKSRGLSARQAYDYVVRRRQCSPDLYVLEDYATALEPGS